MPEATRGQDLGMAALVFCVSLLAYLPALNGGLLWDDDAHVTKPSLQSLEGLWRIWFEPGASQQYYPMLHTAFWVEHRLWGEAVLGYHLTNVLLHATAACLLAVIVRRLFNTDSVASPGTIPTSKEISNPGSQAGRYPGAGWLAAFIFALHPVGVESVAWISEQKNTLSAVFYLGAAAAYLRFDQDRNQARYWQGLVLFGLALLSKTVTATLPAALLVVFWWQRGRLDWRRDILPLLPWLMLGATGGLVTTWVEHTFFVAVQIDNGGPGTEYSLTLLERGLLAGRALCFYGGKLAWPEQLIFTYPQWSVDAAVGWQYLFPLSVAALAVGLLRTARQHRGPLAGFLFFSGTLFPALGFINIYPFIYSYVADHFQYLASIGAIVPFAAGLAWVVNAMPDDRARGLARAGVVLLLSILGILTWQQSGMYRDVKALYEATLARNPSSWMAHSNLGLILAKNPESLPAALAHFETAARLKPRNAEVHNYLGSALARIPGRKAEAIAEFESALRLSPNFPHAHVNLGVALMEFPERIMEALVHLETAVRLKPDLADAQYLLGCALAKIPGRETEAIAKFEQALRINPLLSDAHSNLAIALERIPARRSEAIPHFEAAARLNPTSATAHFNYGYALAEISGRLPEAIAEFESALRLDPKHTEAQFSLAVMLANLPGRTQEALAQFEATLKIKPDHAGARQWIDALRGTPR